jgi:hypothetical protein
MCGAAKELSRTDPAPAFAAAASAAAITGNGLFAEAEQLQFRVVTTWPPAPVGGHP